MNYSLAVDIGASSGRVILGAIKDQQIEIQEIHRFPNEMVESSGQLWWDINNIFQEIKKGIHRCKELGIVPTSIGIDTWAVDFVLLDEKDELLTEAVTYRDARTNGIMEEVHRLISKDNLYEKTGIQFLQFNTIYQLYALQKSRPDILNQAKFFLMIPDYLNFLLTGVKTNEYTNATTTQLVNANTKTWDKEIIRTLGFNEEIFLNIQPPKTILGKLKRKLENEFGFSLDVILPATHDTGSAVAAVPVTEKTIYISSGTWSLIGVENDYPNCSPKALTYNFTNEGGVDGRFRFLKNVMGLWMIQEVRRNYNNEYSYEELVRLAEEAGHFSSIVNVDDPRFLKPRNMITEIQAYCLETNQPIPETPGEIAKCILESLVDSYVKRVQEIEELTDTTYNQINIIGGGSQNEYLNQLVANNTRKIVYAGPVEATAIGNLLVQWIAKGWIKDIHEGRKLVQQSFTLKKYEPKGEVLDDKGSIQTRKERI